MTRILDRYLFGQLMLFTLLLVVGFLAIGVTMRSLDLVELIVNRGLPISDFFRLVALLAPTMLQVVVPFSCAIAILFIYNRLQSDNELIVGSASGISPWRLKAPALAVAWAFAALLLVNGFLLMPDSYRLFEQFRGAVGARFASSLITPNRFIDFGEGRTLYVREIVDGAMQGVMIRDESQLSAPTTLLAERGEVLQASADGRQATILRLFNVAQIGLDPNSGKPFRLSFEQHVISTGLADAADEDPMPRARGLRYAQLQDRLAYARAQGEERYARKLIQSLHERIATPLRLLAFSLLALNILLAADRSRRGLGRYIFTIVALLCLFEMLATIARDAIVDDPRNIWLPYANILLILLGALLLPGLLRRVLKS